MKRHKEPVAPIKKGETEVFVLPPELLQQLGIQLSGITPGNITVNSVEEHSTNENAEEMPCSADGPSILETANLMKQSVFMSPTFLSTNDPETAIEPSEHNILNEPDKHIEGTNVFKEKITAEKNETEKEINYKEFRTENNIDSGVLNKTSCVDDHTDEAYASDGSNSNPGTGTVITNNNKEASFRQNTSNKITILSEQIIHHSSSIPSSKIKKKNTCFHVPVTATIVTGKATKRDSDACPQTKISQKEVNVSPVMKTDLKTDDNLDNKNSVALESMINNTAIEIVSNNEQNLSKSKLCIQGVEKPGGIHDKNTNKVLKTYQRTKVQKQIPDLLLLSVMNNTVDSNVLPEHNIDLDDINIVCYKNENRFCICHDFGQLANYEDEVDYEHLHFRDSNSVGCNLETLFSIYYDSTAPRDLTEENIVAVSNDKDDITLHSICWLSLISDVNDVTENMKVIEESTVDQLRRSNRKRKSTASEHVTENFEPKSKKTVKCGVCGFMLAEADWNKHKDSEHNSIAWKDGETVDLKNKGLLRKLGQRLKKNGVLNCIFCKTDIKYLKMYLQHIKECITKVKKPSSPIESKALLDSGTNNAKSRLNNLESKPIKKFLEVEVPPSTRQSAVEQNDVNLDLLSKTKEVKHSSNSHQKSTTKVIKAEKEDSSNLSELKTVENTSISKSKRTSTDTSTKPIEIKITGKTTNSTTTSVEVTTSNVISSDKKKINVKVKTAISAPNDNTLKTTSKSVDDAGHSKISVKIIEKLDAKSTPIKKSTSALKEVDLFSSPTTPKSTKIDSHIKPSKKSKDEKSCSTPESIVKTSKSPNSDVSAKRTRNSLEIDNSNKQKKSIEPETKEKSKNPITSPGVSVDVEVIPKTPRQYTRKNNNLTNKDVTTPEDTKSVDSPSSMRVRPQNPVSYSTRKSADTVTSQSENASSLKFNKKSTREVSSRMSHVVEIEVPGISETPVVVNAASATRSTRENASTDCNAATTIEVVVPTVSIKQELIPKCGVCNIPVDETQWIDHIAKEHDYLAWREDETALDLQDDDEIRNHLYAIVKTTGGLTCSKCNLTRKYAKSFLTHIRNCKGLDGEESEINASTASTDMDTTQDCDDTPLINISRGTDRRSLLHRSVECGVCNETVMENKWIDHIRIEHKYLAWKKGEPPLDLDDEEAVKDFLRNISKYNGGLICSKCGTTRAYVKKWIDHEATCKGNDLNESSSADVTTEDTAASTEKEQLFDVELLGKTVKCGKCSVEVASKGWMDHIEKEHNYLSWVEGQTPLDESDQEAVSAYLHALVKKRGSLYCVKCGVSRKYPKAFLTHVSACEISGFKREDFYVEVSAQAKPGEFECAVCHETGKLKDWKKHAMSKHYNVAWMAGDIPINLKNPYAVEKYIKEYRSKHNLVCKVCGASRASCYGFYAHILTCGKKENELEHLMEMCDICNNKFLCIYRNQHKAMHKEQMIKKEKKELDAIRAEEEIAARAKEKLAMGEPMGKRRAAEKAKKVMEKYTSNVQDGSNMCRTCHVEFETEDLLKNHECKGKGNRDESSDSDVSIKLEDQEESEDDMEVMDSSVSDEEEDTMKRKRQIESIPKIVLPFKVNDFSYYLSKSFEDFSKMHYTDERLFSKWQSDDFKIISKDESAVYLPSLLESCKLRSADGEWVTFKRFEAQKKKDTTIFTGASIRCMKWVPHRLSTEPQDHYLSVSCYRDSDCPRYGKEELHEHPGLLQFWNMGDLTTPPQLEMCIAHDYGVIWAMDWCPSGARDEATDTEDTRLGLLAIACSNGGTYILSVPKFHNIAQTDPIILKLKPAAELRLSVDPKEPPYRARYQATSISWSPQKGHEVVMVGYADGTTAMYDINTESSILKDTDNGVDIFYPFQDGLAENSTITGVSLSASADLALAVGGAASASATGASMTRWPRGPAVRSHLAASGVAHTPSWPAALLCSDDVLTLKSANEMEWWGGGRRLGGSCASAACARCARMCLTAPPFVRVLRAHPVYPELKKQIVATMKMVPLARKRKLANDGLGMILEPLTYEDTIKKYGLEFKTVPKKDKNVASKLCDNAEQRAERFPLSDMPAAAFCPSAAHHHRLAVASHAGFIFIIST